MQQLANNVLLTAQPTNTQNMAQESLKADDKSGFLDVYQQAQNDSLERSRSALWSGSSSTVSRKQTAVSAPESDDSVSTVLGQISMGKKLPPQEKLTEAAKKLAAANGADEQQLATLSGDTPEQLLQQLAALMAGLADGKQQNLDVTEAGQDDAASSSMMASLQQILASLTTLQNKDGAQTEDLTDSFADLLQGLQQDDDDSQASDEALAALMMALMQFPNDQQTKVVGASQDGSDGTDSSLGQLQQLLASALKNNADGATAPLQGASTNGDSSDLMQTLVSNTDGNADTDKSLTEQLKTLLEGSMTASGDKAAPANTQTLEFQSSDLKALAQHSTGQVASNRQETAHYQMSLRQGLEQQQQTQEMIQRFAPAMKQQLLTMVSNGVHQAEIRLDPPELGSMMVKVQVQGEHTQVQFHVAQPQTRELVEQSMPKLRELLQQQGMQLADSQVSQGGGQQAHAEGQRGGAEEHGDSGEISAEDAVGSSEQTLTSTSAIDYYA